ncbi:MAG: PorT family protein [Deltaproteobacteria bacterium]|nr:PorT family protein [Deltaproteobacteria bacterium]
MKKINVLLLALIISLVSTVSFAQTNTRFAVGGYLGAGFSFAAGDGPERVYVQDRNDRSGKFSGAIGGYFDINFTRLVALELGLGFDSQGVRWTHGDNMTKVRVFYMELPVMVKFNIKHFQIGAGLQLSFALSGKDTVKTPNVTTESTWDGNDWDYFHRVNIGPKFQFGYAIPVGPIAIVPSISWSLHMVNDINRNAIEDDWPVINTDNYKMRFNNLLFNVAVEFGI